MAQPGLRGRLAKSPTNCNRGSDAGPCSMNDTKTSPNELYRGLVHHYNVDLRVPKGRGFGSDALKVDGKIFASLSHGRLLIKLPAERVKALVEAKLGEPFSTGPGRVKKEWVTVGASSADEWLSLSEEARNYVRSQIR
jgi:hypothetical protein